MVYRMQEFKMHRILLNKLIVTLKNTDDHFKEVNYSKIKRYY